jgi:hypothetical protein
MAHHSLSVKISPRRHKPAPGRFFLRKSDQTVQVILVGGYRVAGIAFLHGQIIQKTVDFFFHFAPSRLGYSIDSSGKFYHFLYKMSSYVNTSAPSTSYL